MTVGTRFSTGRMLSSVTVLFIVAALCSGCGGDSASELIRLSNSAVASAPEQATSLGPSSDDTRLEVLISLRQKVSADELHEIVLRETDPSAPERLTQPSLESVVDRVGATGEAVHNVTEFFRGQGLTVNVDATGTFVVVQMTVGHARRLFGAEFHDYSDDRPVCQGKEQPAYAVCKFTGLAEGSHVEVPAKIVTSLPREDVPHRHVYGLTTRTAYFRPEHNPNHVYSTEPDGSTSDGIHYGPDPGAKPYWVRSGTPEKGCSWSKAMKLPGFTPGQIRKAYHFPDDEITADRSVALLEFGGTGSVCQDYLDSLGTCFGLKVPTVSPKKPTDECGMESSLDAAAIASFAPGDETIYVVNNGQQTWAKSAASHSGFMQNFGSALAVKHGTQEKPVDAISISYQDCERDVYTDWHGNILDAEKMFAKAALMHVTVTTGAGDWGSAGSCASPMTGLSMAYPATSAYITAVGGTNLYLDRHNEIAQTMVWNQNLLVPFQGSSATGGGTSGAGVPGFDGVPRPTWQEGKGVRTDLARQVPDVSYIAADPGVIFYWAGSAAEGSGTSYAAPLFAAAALHYNDHNTSRLGLATRLLYEGVNSKKLDFIDITQGDNKAFPYESKWWKAVTCCTAGPGYDTASGTGLRGHRIAGRLRAIREVENPGPADRAPAPKKRHSRQATGQAPRRTGSPPGRTQACR